MARTVEDSPRLSRGAAGFRGWLKVGGALLLSTAAAGCQPPTLEVDVPFAVVDWSPQDGASGVCPSWPVSVCFNEPVNPGSLGDLLLGRSESCDAGAPIANGGAVNGVWQRADQLGDGGSPNCAMLSPPPPGLTPGACYTIEIEGEDLHPGTAAAGDLPDGGTDLLPVTLRSIFQVADTSAGCIGSPDAG